MASRMNVLLVREYERELRDVGTVLFFDFTGLSAQEFDELRRSVSTRDGRVVVMKNSLLRVALRSLGREVDESLFRGATAVVLVKGEAVEVAGALLRWHKEQEKEAKFKGGLLDGKPLSAEDVRVLGELPTKDVLLARTVGAIASPLGVFLGSLREIVGKFARLLKSVEEKGGKNESRDSEV